MNILRTQNNNYLYNNKIQFIYLQMHYFLQFFVLNYFISVCKIITFFFMYEFIVMFKILSINKVQKIYANFRTDKNVTIN